MPLPSKTAITRFLTKDCSFDPRNDTFCRILNNDYNYLIKRAQEELAFGRTIQAVRLIALAETWKQSS